MGNVTKNWKDMIMTVTNNNKEEVVHYQTDTKNIVDWRESYLNELNEYKGKPNGIATLDGDGRIPSDQLYYAMKGISGIGGDVNTLIQNAIGDLVKSTVYDGYGNIVVTKVNGSSNSIPVVTKIKDKDSVSRSSISDKLDCKFINSMNELNDLRDNCTFFGEFNIPGIGFSGADWSGWCTGIFNEQTGDRGQLNQYVANNNTLYHREFDDASKRWTSWKQVSDATEWNSFIYRGNYNTRNDKIPVIDGKYIDYVTKSDIAALATGPQTSFTESKYEGNGYVVFPGGFMIEWGFVPDVTSGELNKTYVNFHKPFNHECFCVVCAGDWKHKSASGANYTTDYSKTGFHLLRIGGTHYIALGY